MPMSSQLCRTILLGGPGSGPHKGGGSMTYDEHLAAAKRLQAASKRAGKAGDEETRDKLVDELRTHHEAMADIKAGKTPASSPAQVHASPQSHSFNDDAILHEARELQNEDGQRGPVNVSDVQEKVRQRYGDDAASKVVPSIKRMNQSTLRVTDRDEDSGAPNKVDNFSQPSTPSPYKINSPSADKVLGIIHSIAERPGANGLKSIQDVRTAVGKQLGAEAATHRNLDPVLKSMHGDKIRMVPTDNRAEQTAGELKDSVPGVENLFTHINPRVGMSAALLSRSARIVNLAWTDEAREAAEAARKAKAGEHDALAKKSNAAARRARKAGDEAGFLKHNADFHAHYKAAADLRAGKNVPATPPLAAAKAAPLALIKPGGTATDDQVHQAVKDLHAALPVDQALTIHALRQHLAEKYGASSGSHAVLDPQLKRMRGDKVRLIEVGDASRMTAAEHEGAIPAATQYSGSIGHIKPIMKAHMSTTLLSRSGRQINLAWSDEAREAALADRKSAASGASLNAAKAGEKAEASPSFKTHMAAAEANDAALGHHLAAAEESDKQGDHAGAAAHRDIADEHEAIGEDHRIAAKNAPEDRPGMAARLKGMVARAKGAFAASTGQWEAGNKK